MCHNLWCQKSCHDNLCCLLIMISCCHGNLAHTSNHVMVTFVYVFVHSVLTICEIIWSNCSWQYLCLCLLIRFWQFVKLDNQLCHKCILCVVWYSCYTTQIVFLCYLLILQDYLSLCCHLAIGKLCLCCLMFILQEKFVFIPCDVTWIEFKYVLGGQKKFISKCDDMSNAIWMGFSMELSLIIIIHGIVIQKICCEI
jgi:hypothetical protein